MKKMKITFLIIGGIIVFVSLILFFVYFGSYPFAQIHYSNGAREGKLIKFSERGIFVKNWCGEISMGTMVSDGDGGFAPYISVFGINRKNNQEMVDKINSLIGKSVLIKYDQRLISNPFVSCEAYIIKEIYEESNK